MFYIDSALPNELESHPTWLPRPRIWRAGFYHFTLINDRLLLRRNPPIKLNISRIVANNYIGLGDFYLLPVCNINKSMKIGRLAKSGIEKVVSDW